MYGQRWAASWRAVGEKLYPLTSRAERRLIFPCSASARVTASTSARSRGVSRRAVLQRHNTVRAVGTENDLSVTKGALAGRARHVQASAQPSWRRRELPRQTAPARRRWCRGPFPRGADLGTLGAGTSLGQPHGSSSPGLGRLLFPHRDQLPALGGARPLPASFR